MNACPWMHVDPMCPHCGWAKVPAQCSTCAGPIYQPRRISSDEPKGYWLHLNASDWHENVHQAVPCL